MDGPQIARILRRALGEADSPLACDSHDRLWPDRVRGHGRAFRGAVPAEAVCDFDDRCVPRPWGVSPSGIRPRSVTGPAPDVGHAAGRAPGVQLSRAVS